MPSLQQKLIATIKKRNITLFEFYSQSRVSRIVYMRFMSGKRVKPITIKRIQRWIEEGEPSKHNKYLRSILKRVLSRSNSATQDSGSA